MPNQQDFGLCRFEDGILTISIIPAIPVGGLDVHLTVAKHFGSTSGVILKSMASGFYNVSGLTILNSGQGIIQANLNSPDTSGLPYGNYAFEVRCYTSGRNTDYTQGYFTVNPSMG